MDYRNCVRCGKLFTYTTRPICDECARKEEEDFIKIKDFISDNPGASLNAISEGTEVAVSRIMKFLKEGRLELSKGNDEALRCERCGRPIKSGRFCETCLVGINSAVSEAFGKPLPEIRKHTDGAPRMYTFDDNKGR